MLKAPISWIRAVFAGIAPSNSIWEPKFVPTSVAEVDKKLGVSAQARKWAAGDLPSILDTQPDAGHQLIYSYFNQQALELHGKASKRLQEYKTLRPSIQPEAFIGEMRAMPDRFAHEAEFRLLQYKATLEQVSSELSATEADYKAFRAAHRVEREPDYPHSHFAYLAIPALLLTFDWTFNAVVFSTASEGLRGGIKIAFVLALVNIVVSAVLGYHVRYLNSRRWYLRVLGGACLAALLLYVPLNLFAAHFRDAAFALQDIDSMTIQQAIERQAGLFPDAKQAFAESPSGMASPESWGLFILGCLFAAISAVDGFKFDDPVPGLSRLHRRIAELREERIDASEACFEELNEYKLGVLDSLPLAQQRFESCFRGFSGYHALCKAVDDLYAQQCEDFRRAYEALIHLYRAENRLHRQSGSAPEYFSRPAVPLSTPKLEVDLLQDQAAMAKFREISQRLSAVVAEVQGEIQSRWTVISRQLPG